MFAAVLSVIVVAWIEKGSLSEIWQIADSHGRIEFNKYVNHSEILALVTLN